MKNHIDLWQWNHSYVNPLYPVHIVTGAGGDQERLTTFDQVFYGRWSVIRSKSYGYGYLQIINQTTLRWQQLLDEGLEEDILWITKDKNTKRENIRIFDTSETESCNEYCLVTCESVARKNGLVDLESCISKCGCEEESLKGLEKARNSVSSQKEKIAQFHHLH